MRYFIICFHAKDKNHLQLGAADKTFFGEFTYPSETYPSRKTLRYLAIPTMYSVERDSAVITNIIEINEEDYKSYES